MFILEVVIGDGYVYTDGDVVGDGDRETGVALVWCFCWHTD